MCMQSVYQILAVFMLLLLAPELCRSTNMVAKEERRKRKKVQAVCCTC
jgi:hypothetical protein